jgi:hypothetical protein
MAKKRVDLRYEPYADRRDKPIGVFALTEDGRHRFMDAVRRVTQVFDRRRSRLDDAAFARGDAVLFALAVLLERARLRHGYTTESVDALLKRLRRTPESFR